MWLTWCSSCRCPNRRWVSLGRPTSKQKWSLLVPCTIDRCTATSPCRRSFRTTVLGEWSCEGLRSAVCWETSSCRWTLAKSIWSDRTRLRNQTIVGIKICQDKNSDFQHKRLAMKYILLKKMFKSLHLSQLAPVSPGRQKQAYRPPGKDSQVDPKLQGSDEQAMSS